MSNEVHVFSLMEMFGGEVSYLVETDVFGGTI
jgi:hypothetical protein